MTCQAERVFLHVGLHKTGTTYLQGVCYANIDALEDQGISFPGGKGQPSQAFAALDLQGRRPRGTKDNRISGSWHALVDAVGASGCPTGLISEERLSLSTVKQARRAVASFPASDVHVVVTVRDLGRVIASAWQEEIKNDQTWTWSEFLEAVKDPARIAVSPARGFWLRQDLVKICEIWEAAGLAADRIHVVTVPRADAAPEVLLRRFASVVGIDLSGLSAPPPRLNETLDAAATEVVRRLNQRLAGRLNQRQYDLVVKVTLVHLLGERRQPSRSSLAAAERPWVSARAEQVIAAVAARGYPVVGDLDELRPTIPDSGRQPDDVTDPELLEASLDALAMLTNKYADLWWTRKKTMVEESPHPHRLADEARAVTYQAKRTMAQLVDRSPTAGKAISFAVRARGRGRSTPSGESDKQQSARHQS